VPETLEKAIIKALQKNPQDRFQTMEEFGSALALDTEEVVRHWLQMMMQKPSGGLAAHLTEPKVRDEYFPKRPSGATFLATEQEVRFLIVIIFAVLALIGTS